MLKLYKQNGGTIYWPILAAQGMAPGRGWGAILEGVGCSTYASLDADFHHYLDGYMALCLVSTIEVYGQFHDFHYVLLFSLAHNISTLCSRCRWIWHLLCFEMGKKCYRMSTLYIPSFWLEVVSTGIFEARESSKMP